MPKPPLKKHLHLSNLKHLNSLLYQNFISGSESADKSECSGTYLLSAGLVKQTAYYFLTQTLR